MKPSNRRNFLKSAAGAALGLGLAPGLGLFYGCKHLDQVTQLGTSVASSAGLISQDEAQSIVRGSQAVSRSLEEITPAQEYYIGRTIGAVILDRYPAYSHPGATHYLNVLGQTLARASALPETYGGYHFLILDSADINGLSAPGGLIFLTRGLLRCCRNEDALAAVLAHEIGHVQYQHGLQAIKKSRLTHAMTVIGTESARQFGGQDLRKLANAFEGAISDITQTLINTGYSRSLEYQADAGAVAILDRLGYSPHGLTDMLQVMQTRLQPGRGDFFKTHPAPDKRIARLKPLIGKHQPVPAVPARQRRFQAAMRAI